jgi:hypothetical protein
VFEHEVPPANVVSARSTLRAKPNSARRSSAPPRGHARRHRLCLICAGCAGQLSAVDANSPRRGIPTRASPESDSTDCRFSA